MSGRGFSGRGGVGIVSLCLAVLFLVSGQVLAAAQAGPGHGPATPKGDPELEAAAKHDLDVAKYYMDKRKAYEGARDRLQEIVDTYPDFTRLDEATYLLGECEEKLNKPEKARGFYKKVVDSFSGSPYAKKASERLGQLGPEPPSDDSDDGDSNQPKDKQPARDPGKNL